MAILLSIALVILWMLTGLGLFAVMRFRTHFHLRLLLAPTFGLAFTAVSLFTLSRIGIPIKIAAIPLCITSIMLASYFLFTQRTIWRRGAFLLYGILVCAALIPFAWPLLKFGFEWLAFVNGDMGYYSLSSSRLLDYSYSDLPTSGNIKNIKDHSLATWDFHNNWSYRTGADLLLAYLAGISGLTAHQVYMPLIIAFNFCVVSGAGALTLLGVRKWSFVLWTMVLVALSPMLTLEVTMQQLAQAIGLALLTSLCVTYAMLMRRSQVSRLALISTILLFSGLAISYFEIIPFFALYVFVFEVNRWRIWSDVQMRIAFMRSAAIFLGSILLLLNTYIFSTLERIAVAVKFSFENSAMTMQTDGVSAFPYFFLPGNGALLWGWMPLSGQGWELVVVLGLLATLFFTGLLFTSKIRIMPSAQMSIAMLAVAVFMWIGGNGYGLFKIAMFIQPFLLASVVGMVALLVAKHLFQQLSIAFLGLSFIPAQQENVAKVTKDIGSSPVAYASSAQLGRQLREIQRKIGSLQNIKVFSDTPSFELFSLQSYYFKGIAFDSLVRSLPLQNSIGIVNKFLFSSESDGVVVDIRAKERTKDADEYLLTAIGKFSVINRGKAPKGLSLEIAPIDYLNNHLMLASSSSGGDRRKGAISVYQLEPDPFFPEGSMSAVGQYHVYEVLGAIEKSRVQLSLSASYSKYEDFRLPNIRALGDVDVILPLIGRGSARVISAPINPRKIGAADYLGIDFGRKGILIDQERKGVMALFGGNIKKDIREVAIFARDISYISSAKYSEFERPKAIKGFPAALADPGLEYSGIFEDGWISEAAYVILQTPSNDSKSILRISAIIPDVDGVPFNPVVKIKINNQIIYNARQEKGELNIAIPIDVNFLKDDTAARIQIESSALQRLPNGDDRPVSMHLHAIGLE